MYFSTKKKKKLRSYVVVYLCSAHSKTLEPNFSLNTEVCFSKQIFSILSINFLMPNISTIILMSFHASSLQPPNSFLWVNWIACSFVGSNLKTGSWTLDMVYGKYWMKYGPSFRNINPRLCLSTFQLHSYIKLVTEWSLPFPGPTTHFSKFCKCSLTFCTRPSLVSLTTKSSQR